MKIVMLAAAVAAVGCATTEALLRLALLGDESFGTLFCGGRLSQHHRTRGLCRPWALWLSCRQMIFSDTFSGDG